MQKPDIVAVIGEYVNLRKAGATYMGRCPFHDEKTPSMSVNPRLQIFKCFGCGATGDVVSFIMRFKQVDFKEAKNILSIQEEEKWKPERQKTTALATCRKEYAFLDNKFVAASMGRYEENRFFQWMKKVFGEINAIHAAGHFFIGTAKGGRTIFWHITRTKQVRTGRVFEYDPETGKRNQAFNAWAHNMLRAKGDFSPCLWGEHQLAAYPPDAIVVLVESSKNAICGHLLYPDMVWLGTDGASGLSEAKAECLAGRNVILMPDCDLAGEKSNRRNIEILEKLGCNIEIVDLLEEALPGTDLADLAAASFEEGFLMTELGYPAIWDEPLTEPTI